MQVLIRRHWWNDLRFSISTLIAITLFIGCWLGWLAHTARVQREAVAAIARAGGSVRYEWYPDETTWWPPEFLVDRIGIDYFDRVVGAYLYGDTSTDRVLRRVVRLDSLRQLSLGGAFGSDEALRRIGGMTHLVFLDLGSTAITDDGLASLEGLTRLGELNLGYTKISDKGLLHLTKLKYLRKLTITGTPVTIDGISAIKLARPGLKVVD